MKLYFVNSFNGQRKQHNILWKAIHIVKNIRTEIVRFRKLKCLKLLKNLVISQYKNSYLII